MGYEKEAGATVHPVIADILRSFTPHVPREPVAAAAGKAEQHYRAALADFDWQAEMSDDYAVIRRSRAALQVLRDMQAEIDPTGEIWLGAMPKDADGKPAHGAPLPAVPAAEGGAA